MNQASSTDFQQRLKNVLDLLKNINSEVKNMPNRHPSNNQFFANIQKQIFEILSLFINLEEDSELEHKLKVYTYIAKFIHEKIDKKKNLFNTCLSAVYFLCGETDSSLVIENEPSNETKKIIAITKEQLMAVKTHYFREKETNFCNQKTEIFAFLAGNSKPTLKKVEESDIYLEDLPQEIQNIFFHEDKDSISFQIYPN